MPKVKDKRSFEEMLLELEAKVARMESGEMDLDELLRQYSEGVALVAACQSKLQAAEAVLATTD
jgi:exodeoxyribonuclease VII small subunit